MAIITVNGIISTPLSEYKTLWQQIYIDAYGSTVNIDDQTPQGQIIDIAALDFKEIDDVLIDTFNSSSINTAVGVQIDNLMKNLGIDRKEAINTEVDVNLTGVAFTVIPATSLARDNNNNIFSLDDDVTLNASGDGAGVMTAVDTGAIFVEAGTLTRIISSVSGWELVNNPSDGITGQAIGTDPASKRLYNRSVKINAQSMIETIEAALLALLDVDDVKVEENFEEFAKIENGVTIAPKSIAASVLGGDPQEIAVSLLNNKGTGVGFTGTTLVSVTDFANDRVVDVLFFETTEIEVEIELTIKTDATFPADGVDQLKQNLVDYFNGEFTGSSGDNSGFGVGEDVVFSRLFTPINAVQGAEVTSLLIGRLGDTLLVNDIVIDLNEKSLLLETNINVIKI